MPDALFRPVALEQLKKSSSPDQLDMMLHITGPRGWLALASLAGVLIVAIIWSIFGSVATTINGQGVLIRQGGAFNIPATQAGQISAVNVQPGLMVKKGDIIATLAGQGNVTSPFAGRILDVLVNPGELVSPGVPVANLEQSDQPLEAVAYVPASVGKSVQPGMEVQISPSSAPKAAFGFMYGKVSSVAPFPSTQQGMMRLLENDTLVHQLISSTSGAPLEVHITLTPDSKTPSGYQWSSGQGFPGPITSGTLSQASIILRQQRPISLVLPVG